ncbi:MAG: crossover junction endodeoxyribonuclease RuvC [Candidatus Paceibacterota bacterium]
MSNSTRVLGIDPGYDRCGVAIIEKDKEEVLLHSECIETEKSNSLSSRLHHVGKRVEELIKKYRPDACALEKLYFGNNQKTATSVSEVRGMLLFLAESHNLSVFEYTPQQIKVAVTGYGRSDKESVIDMVPRLIRIKKEIKYDDEFDAIAIALTSLASEKW